MQLESESVLDTDNNSNECLWSHNNPTTGYVRGGAPLGYRQHWKCGPALHSSSENTFIDGGVYFNQTDKSIYVPRCANYYIYSQILFRVEDSTATGQLHYTLRFERNCGGDSSGAVEAVGTVASGLSTTVFTGSVVTLCRGGRVYVEVPNGSLCCPYGDPVDTFLGITYVAAAECKWPPRVAYDTE